MSVSFEEVRAIARALPGVEEGPCYGTPGFRVRKRLIARLKEDGETLVIRISFEEREFLLEADPQTFFVTDHYRNYPAVLVRMERVDPEHLRSLIVRHWRTVAPKKLVAAWDVVAAASL